MNHVQVNSHPALTITQNVHIAPTYKSNNRLILK